MHGGNHMTAATQRSLSMPGKSGRAARAAQRGPACRMQTSPCRPSAQVRDLLHEPHPASLLPGAQSAMHGKQILHGTSLRL